jgi:hypothetical protein
MPRGRRSPAAFCFSWATRSIPARFLSRSVEQVPKDVFATVFPGAAEVAETFGYFQAHTYLGSDWHDRIALANKIAGRQPSKFSTWARENLPVPVG